MQKFIIVAIGGGIGAVLRFVLSGVINQAANFHAFPFGTVLVNLIGSFAIGFLAGMFESLVVAQEWRLFLFTGILGGFTTFSSFGLETISLFRQSQNGLAFANVMVSNLLGIAMVAAGFFLAVWLWRVLN
jgi:CrcB protein